MMGWRDVAWSSKSGLFYINTSSQGVSFFLPNNNSQIIKLLYLFIKEWQFYFLSIYSYMQSFPWETHDAASSSIWY